MALALLRHVATIAAALALFPLVSRTLGPAALGTWTILGTTSFVLGLADLGLSSTTQRRAARGESIDDVVGWSATAVIVLAPIAATAIFAGLPVPPLAAAVTAIAGIVAAYGSSARALLLVRGRLRVLARARVASAAVQLACAALGLWIFRDLVMVALALFLANAVELAIVIDGLPEVRLRPRWPRKADRAALRVALGEGSAALTLNVAVALAIRIDVFALARTAPLAVVAAYGVGARAIDQSYVLAKQASTALLPRLGAASSRSAAVTTGTRVLVVVTAAASATLLHLGKPVLVAWVGAATVSDTTRVAVLLLGAAAVVASMHDVACSAVALAAKDAWAATRAIAAGAAVNVVLTVSLSGSIGAPAVAAATVVGNLVTSFLVWTAARRLLGWSRGQVLELLARPLVAVLAVHAIGLALARVAPQSIVTTAIGGALLLALAALVVFGVPARARMAEAT